MAESEASIDIENETEDSQVKFNWGLLTAPYIDSPSARKEIDLWRHGIGSGPVQAAQ